MTMDKAERQAILEAFAPLRVADVSDGMDWMMMPDIGLMSNAIRPLYRTRVCGIAKTFRYVPTNRRTPTMSPEAYTEYSNNWYGKVCTYPIGGQIEPGDVVVVDASDTDVGLLGSNNVLEYIAKGASAIVTNGGCRDTDEVILQDCPVFCRHISRTMVQGRLEYHSMMEPVNCGGVLVRPGDVIVGDGDGIIVVPREKALDVAKWASKELASDKVGRRRLYEARGMKLDETVLTDRRSSPNRCPAVSARPDTFRPLSRQPYLIGVLVILGLGVPHLAVFAAQLDEVAVRPVFRYLPVVEDGHRVAESARGEPVGDV